MAKGWIKKAAASIRRPGICTGKKYGGPTCPAGSRQYALATVFRNASHKKKKK